MGNVVSHQKKDQVIEDPEIIDGPDDHTPPGKLHAAQLADVEVLLRMHVISGYIAE